MNWELVPAEWAAPEQLELPFPDVSVIQDLRKVVRERIAAWCTRTGGTYSIDEFGTVFLHPPQRLANGDLVCVVPPHN